MDTVSYALDGRIAVVTIERPERRNAVDGPTARALYAAFQRFDADEGADVAVLQGRGGHFCGGADLKAISERGPGRANTVREDSDLGPMGPTRMRLTKPVIAAVEGYAVAGGLELSLWADLRVAAESAIFGVFCRKIRRAADRPGHRAPAPPDRPVAGPGPDPHRPAGPGAGGVRDGPGQPRRPADGQALSEALALARQIAAFPQTVPAQRPPLGAGAVEPGLGRGYRQRGPPGL